MTDAYDKLAFFNAINTKWRGAKQDALVQTVCEYSLFIIKKLQFHCLHPQYEGNYSLDTFFVVTLSSGIQGAVGDGTPIRFVHCVFVVVGYHDYQMLLLYFLF